MEIIDYQIQKMKRKCRSGANYIRHFFIWVSISMVVGLFGGLVGSLFHIFIEKGTEFRESNPWMIFLLPLAGLLIVFIYRITKRMRIWEQILCLKVFEPIKRYRLLWLLTFLLALC